LTSEEAGALQANDPVCNMTFDSEDAAARSEWRNGRIYFCSTDCKEEFDSDPAAYAEEG
jgi:YHS domain-containing protein